MKRTMGIILSASLAIAILLSGCGENMTGKPSSTAKPETTTAPTASPAVTADPTAEPDMLLPDPEEGIVTDKDGIITDDDSVKEDIKVGENKMKAATRAN